uniref:Predicted protein n=1 Tax=Hordeum vulgare subsp. vulgare TaxID=112509 RepID=F2DIR4_HORVV|nr:predicted protein [Hordeum vulgare subsp. vulgare]
MRIPISGQLAQSDLFSGSNAWIAGHHRCLALIYRKCRLPPGKRGEGEGSPAPPAGGIGLMPCLVSLVRVARLGIFRSFLGPGQEGSGKERRRVQGQVHAIIIGLPGGSA